MSRYLTPSKIGLIALVLLYLEDFVPADSCVPVLSFIAFSILPPGSSPPTVIRDLKGIHSITVETFYKTLSVHSSSIPGRTLWDVFLEKIWGIDSFNGLHAFFYSLTSRVWSSRDQRLKDLKAVIPHPKAHVTLSRRSLIGIFLRRAQLEFNHLQLQDIVKLWRALITFKEPTILMWRKRNPSSQINQADVSQFPAQPGTSISFTTLLNQSSGCSTLGEMEMSMSDAEGLLELQIDRMQQLGLRLSEDMKSRLGEMMDLGAAAPNLSHYVNFLESWKVGEYPSAFESLHRYFDHTLQKKDKTCYQYALLNLAIMHADFGCLGEALSTMQEAIVTARENKDIECLNHSLSWLLTFSDAVSEGLHEDQQKGTFRTENEMLVFLKSKAKESQMWSILSACLLNEARIWLSRGTKITSALESITQASHLNSLRFISNSIGSQMAIQGSLFNRLGFRYLACSFGTLFLECYATQASTDEVLQCCITLTCSYAQKGRLKESFDILSSVNSESLRSLRNQQHWIAHMGLLNLHEYLQRRDLNSAIHHLNQLQATSLPNQAFAFILRLRELDLQVLQGNVDKSMLCVKRTISHLDVHKADVFQRVKLMTLKARFYQQHNVPQKALSVALRATSLAYKARIAPVLWEATEILAQVMLSISEFEVTARMLESILPQVMECGDCELVGACMASTADAYMGLAGQSTGKRAWKVKERMVRALGYLELAENEFARAGNVKMQREVLAKKGIILMISGDRALANDCAARYVRVEEIREARLR